MFIAPNDIPTVAEAEARVQALIADEAELRKRANALKIALEDTEKRLRAMHRSFNNVGEIETARMLVEVARKAEVWDAAPVVRVQPRGKGGDVVERRLAKVTPKQIHVYTTRGSTDFRRFDRATGEDVCGDRILNMDEVLSAATKG